MTNNTANQTNIKSIKMDYQVLLPSCRRQTRYNLRGNF